MPSQTSRGRKSRTIDSEAADVIRVAVRDGGRIEAPDAVVTQHGADDAVADVEGGRTAGSPPASTSSVVPRGNRTSVASPCPTSMKVTCSDPSPRAASRRDGSKRIQAAAATPASSAADASRP